MRDFEFKLRIIWRLITDQYCFDRKNNCWWLFNKENEQQISIVFHKPKE